MANLGKLVRDPFIQFLLLGGIIFAIFSMIGDDDDTYRSITVSNADVARLEAQWTNQYSKPPTAQQKMSIIDQFVREEILFREARRLDLGEDDIIIRRRMVQKYQFLSEEMLATTTAITTAPTKDELREYFAANRGRYSVPKKSSFLHVYFKEDRKKGNDNTISAEYLASDSIALLNNPAVDTMAWQSEGEAFMLQRQYAERTDKEIAEFFGIRFSKDLSTLETGVWAGPVQSVYGWHAVKVVGRTKPQLQLLGEIHEEVMADYLDDQRQKNNRTFYQKTRKSYKVVYENPIYRPAVTEGSENLKRSITAAAQRQQ